MLLAKPGLYSSQILVPATCARSLMHDQYVEELENGVLLWRKGTQEEQYQALLSRMPAGRQRDILQRKNPFGARVDTMASLKAGS